MGPRVYRGARAADVAERRASAERERGRQIETALEGGPADDRPHGARSPHRPEVVDARDAPRRRAPASPARTTRFTDGDVGPPRRAHAGDRGHEEGMAPPPRRATQASRRAAGRPARRPASGCRPRRSRCRRRAGRRTGASPRPRRLVGERARAQHDASRAGVEHRLRVIGRANAAARLHRPPERRRSLARRRGCGPRRRTRGIHVDDVEPARARRRLRSRRRDRIRRRTSRSAPAPAASTASRPPATSIAGSTSKLMRDRYPTCGPACRASVSGMRVGGDCDDGPVDLPVFALHTVLFPGASMGLRVFEPRYLALMDDVLPGGTFAVVAIKHGAEVGGDYEANRVGATIVDRRTCTRGRRHACPPRHRPRSSDACRVRQQAPLPGVAGRALPRRRWRRHRRRRSGRRGAGSVPRGHGQGSGAAADARAAGVSRDGRRATPPHDPVAASYVLAAATPGLVPHHQRCSRCQVAGERLHEVRATFRREAALVRALGAGVGGAGLDVSTN